MTRTPARASTAAPAPSAGAGVLVAPLSPRPGRVTLTRAQVRALALAGCGYTSSGGAKRVGWSVSTLKTHLAHARGRLGAVNTAHAVVLAYRAKWLRDEDLLEVVMR